MDERGSNLLDSGTPFIDTYETADGRYLAVVALEEPFYQEFVSVLGIADTMPKDRFNPATFDEQREIISTTLLTKTRDEWVDAFEGKDACVGPVLSLTEAPQHPHNVARGTFFDRDGHPEPAPAPRFSRTQPATPEAPKIAGDIDAETILSSWDVNLARP